MRNSPQPPPPPHRPKAVERRVDVYLPSIERREAWHQAARERGVKLSQMIYNIVEMHLAEEADATLRPEAASAAELDALREELARAHARNEELESHAARLQREVDLQRAHALMGDAPHIVLDARLIRILRQARTADGQPRAVTTRELHRALQLDLEDEVLLAGLSAQMNTLHLHGLVKLTNKGWEWHE